MSLYFFTFLKKTIDKSNDTWYTCKVFCFTPLREAFFTGTVMFEKNLTLGYLLDFYGELLPERKRSVMDMYYNEDLSLSEIAAEVGISRQGVRDIIKKSEEELLFYENKLGLAKRLKDVEACASDLREMAARHSLPEDLLARITDLLNLVKL